MSEYKVGSFTILYIADGAMQAIGPFDSDDLAMTGARKAQADGEFDINDQHVYLFPPDHRFVELTAADLFGKADDGGKFDLE
jgi:hypothetical protein